MRGHGNLLTANNRKIRNTTTGKGVKKIYAKWTGFIMKFQQKLAKAFWKVWACPSKNG